MNQDRNDLNIDDLLDDLHELLGEAPAAEELPPEKPAPKPYQPPVTWAETQRLPRHVAKLQQNQGDAYEKWLREQSGREQEDSAKRSWTETQKLPRHVAKLQQNQNEAYEKWQREQRKNPPPPPPPVEEDLPPEPKKHGNGLRNYLIFLLVLIVLLAAVIAFVLPGQPEASVGGMGDRTSGVSTLLLAGLDSSGTRTDTLILLTLDSSQKAVRLVSIPRDTLVPGDYDAPRLNGVYGLAGGGQKGINALLEQVRQLTGFRPDGYIVIDMPTLQNVVDALGGVEFDVPMDMAYADPTQNLVIDLKSGRQILDGESALELVRFRDGYSDADLGRIQTQREFLAALINTAASPDGLLKTPELYRIFREQVQTDLTAANWLWLARTALTADKLKISSATLPGSSTYLSGVSCYILDPELTAAMVNAYSSPYKRDIAVSDLNIRTK